ncbi:MAG: glycosyltransferase [Rhizobiaceae bacterium]|nr:glycosyltransferase [Rhizobiaceae bacterium]MCZ8352367.1 glycosyltransferase [Rhizobium sp.]
MILVTVGTQLPFDRLVKYMDTIAAEIDEEVVAQIGKTTYAPKSMRFYERLSPVEFDELGRAARIIVSHAGIGTILSARRYGKPIVVVPRLALHGEHRNDHQIATCEQLIGVAGIQVQMELDGLGDRIMTAEYTQTFSHGVNQRKKNLIEFLKKYISVENEVR